MFLSSKNIVNVSLQVFDDKMRQKASNPLLLFSNLSRQKSRLWQKAEKNGSKSRLFSSFYNDETLLPAIIQKIGTFGAFCHFITFSRKFLSHSGCRELDMISNFISDTALST